VCKKNLKFKIYKTIIFLEVLYGCRTWFLAVREEGIREHDGEVNL
jgi:hypothetical protein